MKDKPRFKGEFVHGHFDDGKPGYFTVVVISSDGKNFSIEFGESLIPHFTNEVLEKMKFILEDGMYRIRPDLRRQ